MKAKGVRMRTKSLPAELVNRIHRARHVVVLTGAGVSADSGVPTFRDAQTGTWRHYDPMTLASPEAFAEHPERVAQWYDHRRQMALRCMPNAAHDGLAELEAWLTERGSRFTLLTQNVDRLHQRAGSRNVWEMHGSLLRWRCVNCGEERVEQQPEPFDEHPPRCAKCGGSRRPCVVWFGEALPEQALTAADEAVADCDAFLSVGTMAVVFPVAGYIYRAMAREDVLTCEINPSETDATPGFDFRLADRAANAVAALVRAATGG